MSTSTRGRYEVRGESDAEAMAGAKKEAGISAKEDVAGETTVTGKTLTPAGEKQAALKEAQKEYEKVKPVDKAVGQDEFGRPVFPRGPEALLGDTGPEAVKANAENKKLDTSNRCTQCQKDFKDEESLQGHVEAIHAPTRR